MGSPVDMHTHAGSAFDNCVTLTFDLLTSGSMHAERLPLTVCLPSLVLVARAVFPIKRTQTHTHTQSQTQLMSLAMHGLATVDLVITRRLHH